MLAFVFSFGHGNKELNSKFLFSSGPNNSSKNTERRTEQKNQ